MSTELTRQEDREPSTMEMIARITSSPDFNAAKMDVVERLVALKERTDAQARENSYAAAMADLQAELPQIDKHGKIIVQGSLRSTYARIEDIDAQVRPYLAKHGFSFSWNTEAAPTPGEIRYNGTVTHRAGYSVTQAR